MKYFVCRHNGRNIGLYDNEDAAIDAARSEAVQSGHRVNVYPLYGDDRTGERVVSVYPRNLLWERDLAGLDHTEYMARHKRAAAGL